MSFPSFFNSININKGVEEYLSTADALLMDVRNPHEYNDGHIPHSKNLPLNQIDQITLITEDKNTPLFVYCRSGARSSQAASLLMQMGYTNVHNIGGILHYTGELEK